MWHDAQLCSRIRRRGAVVWDSCQDKGEDVSGGCMMLVQVGSNVRPKPDSHDVGVGNSLLLHPPVLTLLNVGLGPRPPRILSRSRGVFWLGSISPRPPKAKIELYSTTQPSYITLSFESFAWGLKKSGGGLRKCQGEEEKEGERKCQGRPTRQAASGTCLLHH